MKSHYVEEPYVEKQRPPRYDDLDLFKQSYDYADGSHELGYRADRRRAPSHSRPSRRHDDDDYYRRDDRRGRYADYDLHRYYTEEPVARERRRRHSFSDSGDQYYSEPAHPYEGKRRRQAHEDSRRTRKRPKKQAPEATGPATPGGQQTPQRPAQ